jgi:hypothetical protein
MKPKSEKAKVALRDSALSLAKECPVDRSNPDDCPLHGVRQLGPVRSCQWIRELSEDDLSYLNAYHNVCAAIKMEAQFGKKTSPSATRLYVEGTKNISGNEEGSGSGEDGR